MIEIKGKQYIKEILLNKLIVKHQQNIKNSFANHGRRMSKLLQKTIKTGSRSGRVYTFRGQKYTASAPGEPPANRTGKLANSFGFQFNYDEMNVFSTAFTKKNKPYPLFLEGGTVKMDARPYFAVTLEKHHNELIRDLQNLKA